MGAVLPCITLLVLSITASVTAQGYPSHCAINCNNSNDPSSCSTGSFATQPDGCHYPDCSCAVNPPNDSECHVIKPGQSECPKDCGLASNWVTAINGCKSCSCKSDVGMTKAGICPSNASDRAYYLGTECEDFGDFFCKGVQKCCQAPHGPPGDMHCVDPEPSCPAPTSDLRRWRGGHRCNTNKDCAQGHACCGTFRKKCVQGLLPDFPPIKFGTDQMIQSPEDWA